jgi:hypothetical protein
MSCDSVEMEKNPESIILGYSKTRKGREQRNATGMNLVARKVH